MEGQKRKLIILSCFALFLFLFCQPAFSQKRILRAIQTTSNRVLNFVTHPDFVAFLDYVVSFSHAYYDASYDAVFWQINANRQQNWTIEQINDSMYGHCNISNIHYYKNMARLALALKGYCIGISLLHVRDGKLEGKTLLWRELGMIPGMMAIWQLRYKYGRYGKAWDTSAEHNGTRYVVPFPSGDWRIGLEGWQVSLATSAEIGISSYFLGKDSYKDFKTKKERNQFEEDRKLKPDAKLSYQQYNWAEFLCSRY
ncbi:hypothetical protein L0Z72_09980 [candidate division KSB1 bacterium]|nr:hypothetical protein [candidate division KSB1 bacterium]